MYRGYDIHEMGDKATFEEVAYLLLNGELPNGKQLKNFKQQIAAQRDLPKEVVEMLRLLLREKPLPEKPELSQAANFFYKLDGKAPEAWQTRMLDTIFNLYADHEFNASTFAARVTASTFAGIYA